jgi:anaerobic magnesium-protoporphyrin IX monomethyl ester cyclase
VILFLNPRATRPKNRRFPLSLLALGAALPEGVSWEILDGNLPDADLEAETTRRVQARSGTDDPVTLVAMTVMPGPQLVAAVPLARRLKERFPSIPIVWGGYFPSLYPQPVLRAPYVDFLVRGQGERTLVELLDVLAGRRDPAAIAGLGWKQDGEARINPERPWEGPDALPMLPWHRIALDTYLQPTALGERNGVYQASIGCLYTCNFCGVIAALGSLQRFESPARTEANLLHLVKGHGMDAVHFYDNNFFLKEPHAEELAERMTPLGLKWWCEARIDAMLRFSDRTWEALRLSGLTMVYYGAESGSDETLKKMSKNLTTAQTLALAEKTRRFGIVPEFSFMFGDPDDAEQDVMTTLAFVEKLAGVNPDMKLITYFYTPTPQRRGTYGNVDPLSSTPATLEEWTTPEWAGWMTHEDPLVPWFPRRLKERVEDFARRLKGGLVPSDSQAYGHLRRPE